LFRAQAIVAESATGVLFGVSGEVNQFASPSQRITVNVRLAKYLFRQKWFSH